MRNLWQDATGLPAKTVPPRAIDVCQHATFSFSFSFAFLAVPDQP